MSAQAILLDSRSATSSQASASGLTLYVQQDGQTTFLFGPAVALASLSARQALELGLRTQGTFGQPLPGSSSSANLQSSLESRLRARLSSLGSTLYTLTWKPWTTPSGPSRFRLRASVRRISETDCSGWRSPNTVDAKLGSRNGPGQVQLCHQVLLTGWPTPKVTDTNGPGNSTNRQGGMALHTCAQLSGWPAPTACDSNRHPSQEFTTPNITLNHAAVLAGWATPKACDGKGNAYEPDPECRRVELRKQVILCGPARSTVSGQMLTGSDAEMGSGGQLNPAHSRWLMALPREWDDCAPTETLSMLKRRRSL